MDVSCGESEVNKDKALTAGTNRARSRGWRDLASVVDFS